MAKGTAVRLLSAVLLSSAVVTAYDPCAKFAGKVFAPPADVLACFQSFPFNETLRQNILTVVERVFNFYTFEDYYLNSPPPFQESTSNIRAQLARINSTTYPNDYAFNRDLYNFVNQLNDGHTLWYPYCYVDVQNILPAPVVSLEVNGIQGVYIAPDSAEVIPLIGPTFVDYFASIGFDWMRLAGAKVLAIEGQDPYIYADYIARTVSGNYLDHGVRVNSVFSSYRLIEATSTYSQRFGDIAGPLFPDREYLTMTLLLVNCTEPETVAIPYLSSYFGQNFTDSKSYWTNNCAANNITNGVSFNPYGAATLPQKHPIGKIIDRTPSTGVGLPTYLQPSLDPIYGSNGSIKSYILPDNQTGVMFVGGFAPTNFTQFQYDAASAVTSFQKAGVTKLLVDLTNNGGGYVCLGLFLAQYLAGAQFGYGGFQSTLRANTLAQKILVADIKLGLNSSYSYYTADNFAFFNDTTMPATYDYFNPSVPLTVNGVPDYTSQRFHDSCAATFVVKIPSVPAFHPSNIAIVSNGQCASTCALFSTSLYERLNVSIGIFGGRPGQSIEYKGMAGNQVLEWYDIDSEIKTAGLKNDSLAPPDLLVNANFRHNWRIAWSWLNESLPIAFRSEIPQYRFAYTPETYMNPVMLWAYAAKQMLCG